MTDIGDAYAAQTIHEAGQDGPPCRYCHGADEHTDRCPWWRALQEGDEALERFYERRARRG